jgi:hypothetical protein
MPGLGMVAHMPVISATWEAEIEGSVFKAGPEQKHRMLKVRGYGSSSRVKG